MIAGVSVEVGSEAVMVSSHQPLRVLSSALHLGGFTQARAVRVALDRAVADWRERRR